MLELLWLVPILPLAGFVILALAGTRISKRGVSAIGVGSVLLSCIIAILIGIAFVGSVPLGNAYSQVLGSWFKVADFQVDFGLYLDALSVVMIAVVTFVALLIHLYSVEFMARDEGYSRFFAYMNLFVASMLILVLADNLLLLYLGWEGVGLCSYLLIGFWYKEKENCNAAVKAFIVTRIGDTLMVIGLFMLLIKFGTLGIGPVMEGVSRLASGSVFCSVAALLLLGGAVGKSAQLPLQIWLPDAMAGPTPVSALIHAATMVTAGVYLIARTHAIFMMAPEVMHIVAVIGAVTLLLAAFSAFVQTDIKRILAYSTMSQVGYMFLALGVGAWSAAIYHFMVHALFKSAMFLCAGVLIMGLDGEHDIFKMGGLRKVFPNTFRAFVLAALVLAAIPPFSITYNSKDVILNSVWSCGYGSRPLWTAGAVGAFITAAYTFRLLFVVFFGQAKVKPGEKSSLIMIVPLTILAFLAAISGIPELLSSLFGVKGVYGFLYTALPQVAVRNSLEGREWLMQIFYAAVSLAAMGLTYVIYCHPSRAVEAFSRTFIAANLHGLLRMGWAFEWLYDKVFVRPYIYIARINRRDFIDRIYDGLMNLFEYVNRLFSMMVNGRLRWYVTCIVIGSIIIIGIIIFL
jgi:NADH-quinone oxidoreductase subunit L